MGKLIGIFESPGSVILQNIHVAGDHLGELSVKCQATGYIAQRLTNPLLIVGTIFQWDGLWSLLDFYMGQTDVSYLICWAWGKYFPERRKVFGDIFSDNDSVPDFSGTVPGTGVLVAAGVHNNIAASVPYILRHDTSKTLFNVDSRFGDMASSAFGILYKMSAH